MVDKNGKKFVCSKFTGKYPTIRINADKPVTAAKPKCNKYGLSAEILRQILIDQKNKCSICERIEYLTLDHNHLTNKARGYLCRTCNTLLSGFNRPVWRERAEKYLKNPPAAKYYNLSE